MWKGARPRHVFAEGIFVPPACNFYTIQTIEASGMGITTLTPAIQLLSSLVAANISHNALHTLPIETTSLRWERIHTFDIDGNPVATKLDWSNAGLGVCMIGWVMPMLCAQTNQKGPAHAAQSINL